MAKYTMNEGTFELPDLELEDRTVQLFELRLPSGEELGLLVCRATLPEGKTLREVVEVHLTEEARKLGGYKILDEREANWGGAPALEVCARWRNEGEVLYQRQAHLAAGGTWLLFGTTAPLSVRDEADAIFNRMLASLRFFGTD